MYETWLYAYETYLREMRAILASNFCKHFPELNNFLYSEDFFHLFAKMIWENSSKKISPYLDLPLEKDTL